MNAFLLVLEKEHCLISIKCNLSFCSDVACLRANPGTCSVPINLAETVVDEKDGKSLKDCVKE